MKKTRLVAFAAFFSSVLLLAGCAGNLAGTAGSTPVVQTPAVAPFVDTAIKVCNVAKPLALGVQNTMNHLTTPLDASDTKNIQSAVKKVNAFCDATATVSTVDVQTLVNDLFPLLSGVIEDSSLSANGKNLAIIGLGVAQTAITILVPSVTPSSAPVSAATVPDAETTTQAQ